jgi:hypothetical protein
VHLHNTDVPSGEPDLLVRLVSFAAQKLKEWAGRRMLLIISNNTEEFPRMGKGIANSHQFAPIRRNCASAAPFLLN